MYTTLQWRTGGVKITFYFVFSNLPDSEVCFLGLTLEGITTTVWRSALFSELNLNSSHIQVFVWLIKTNGKKTCWLWRIRRITGRLPPSGLCWCLFSLLDSKMIQRTRDSTVSDRGTFFKFFFSFFKAAEQEQRFQGNCKMICSSPLPEYSFLEASKLQDMDDWRKTLFHDKLD